MTYIYYRVVCQMCARKPCYVFRGGSFLIHFRCLCIYCNGFRDTQNGPKSTYKLYMLGSARYNVQSRDHNCKVPGATGQPVNAITPNFSNTPKTSMGVSSGAATVFGTLETAQKHLYASMLVGGGKEIFARTHTARTRTNTCDKHLSKHHSAAHTVTARARRNKIDKVRDTFSGRACAHPE
jgi:hypothetical protein